MQQQDSYQSEDEDTITPTGGLTDEAVQEAIDGFDRAIKLLPADEKVWRARFTRCRHLLMEELGGRGLGLAR